MSRCLTALVIGNADYADAGVLKNPGNDAEDISAKLDDCGFTVATKLDCTHMLRHCFQPAKGRQSELHREGPHG
ncbi:MULTISPECIES: caspase family protein [Paraburkholderia]|uniref:caspase family protein n=1 Tax=Paraburkholderia TaxID=1822464 RepID=UPI002AB6F2D2|nr:MULTISPECIES: caspase family protein [Paraburkholderia]